MPFCGPMVESEDTLVLGTSAIVREGATLSRATTFADSRSVLTRSCKSRSPERSWKSAPFGGEDQNPVGSHKPGLLGATPSPATNRVGIPLKRRARL
jgi:hypothetical protein